jgi:hypothetical protein
MHDRVDTEAPSSTLPQGLDGSPLCILINGPNSPAEDPIVACDRRIAEQLRDLSTADDDYWTFRKETSRRLAHGLTQYPAMMVPSMQAVLLEVIAKNVEQVSSVLDPFCGSGTTLIECMRLGLNYSGQDINPLSVLICRAKAGPFQCQILKDAVIRVLRRATKDGSNRLEAEFPGLGKWFTRPTAIRLSRIRRAIRRETQIWCRLVFWTALAETVRRCSNSRTSTFKLHIRDEKDLESREIQVLSCFASILVDMTLRLRDEEIALRESGRLTSNGQYCGQVSLHLGNSAKQIPVTDGCRNDLIITSPPYGDNPTTVPYGQYSYLPLQWIDLCDIDGSADSKYLSSTHEIDHRSLGGSKKRALSSIKRTLPQSPSLDLTLVQLAALPKDRATRVAAFFRDFDECLDPILGTLRSNGYLVWTVGNRRVGGVSVPMDKILTELLLARGLTSVARIERAIPSKRMAPRNNIASTMHGETILVFRKG